MRVIITAQELNSNIELNNAVCKAFGVSMGLFNKEELVSELEKQHNIKFDLDGSMTIEIPESVTVGYNAILMKYIPTMVNIVTALKGIWGLVKPMFSSFGDDLTKFSKEIETEFANQQIAFNDKQKELKPETAEGNIPD